MKIAGKTDIGNKRSENQDRYTSGQLSNGCTFAFVCDGMGGVNGGQVASSITIKHLEESLFMKSDYTLINDEEIVHQAIAQANDMVLSKAQHNPELKGMGTTVSGVSVIGNQCKVYNVGDSRVYIYRENQINQITEDHSVVQELFNQGIISKQELVSHPQKNLITRAIGVSENVSVDTYEVDLKDNDIILCASDGLTNFVEEEKIKDIIGNSLFFDIPKKLINAALENNATDNITAVVLAYN